MYTPFLSNSLPYESLYPHNFCFTASPEKNEIAIPKGEGMIDLQAKEPKGGWESIVQKTKFE